MLRRGFVAFAAIAVAFSAQAQQTDRPAALAKPEKPNLTLAIGGVSAQMYFLPVVLADRLGFFAKAGLNPNKIDTGSGAKALQAVVSGGADVGAGSFEHPIRLQARGQDIKAFAKFGRFHGNVLGVVASRAKDYKTPADMKGWKIGVSAPGSSSQLFAALLLAKNGISPDQVSFIAVTQGPGGIAAVRKGGQLDAVSLTDPSISELESTNDIVVVADSRKLEGTTQVYGGETISGVLYATGDFLEKNPNTAQALATAIAWTLDWMKTASIEDIAKNVPPEFAAGRPELYRTMIERNITSFRHDGTFSPDAAELTLNFLRSTDAELKDSKVDVRKAYDPSFAEKAKTMPRPQ